MLLNVLFFLVVLSLAAPLIIYKATGNKNGKECLILNIITFFGFLLIGTGYAFANAVPAFAAGEAAIGASEQAGRTYPQRYGSVARRAAPICGFLNSLYQRTTGSMVLDVPSGIIKITFLVGLILPLSPQHPVNNAVTTTVNVAASVSFLKVLISIIKYSS